MKRKLILMLLFFIFFLALFLFLLSLLFFNKEYKKIKIGNTEIVVEIAKSNFKKKKGLSQRDFLPANQGMLFIFDKPDFYRFWMKEMKFPLDFIWIKGDTIVDITEKVKPEDFQPPNSILPKEKVDKVLEVNSGFAEKYNIKIGDKVIF